MIELNELKLEWIAKSGNKSCLLVGDDKGEILVLAQTIYGEGVKINKTGKRRTSVDR